MELEIGNSIHEHSIPTTIKKAVRDLIAISKAAEQDSKDQEKQSE